MFIEAGKPIPKVLSLRNVIMESVTPGYETTSLTPEFIGFAKRQLINATMFVDHNNRRGEDRHPMMLPILAVAIDDEGNAISEVFEMISRDVASATIGLFHQEELQHKYFAIRLSLANILTDLSIEVLWQAPQGPFFGSAARYLKKLNQFPTDLSGL